MFKLVNLITGLFGFVLFAVHDHCHFCFGFGAI